VGWGQRIGTGGLLEGWDGVGGQHDQDFGGARVDEAHALQSGVAEGGFRWRGYAEGVDPDFARGRKLGDGGEEDR